MSTGADCRFTERKPREWWYSLQQWPYGQNPDYDDYGPFGTFDEARRHLDNHHANPGGYSVSALPGCPHDLLVERDQHWEWNKGKKECLRCGEQVKNKGQQ